MCPVVIAIIIFTRVYFITPYPLFPTILYSSISIPDPLYTYSFISTSISSFLHISIHSLHSTLLIILISSTSHQSLYSLSLTFPIFIYSLILISLLTILIYLHSIHVYSYYYSHITLISLSHEYFIASFHPISFSIILYHFSLILHHSFSLLSIFIIYQSFHSFI